MKQYEDGPGPEKRWRELSDHPLLYQLSLEFDFSRPPRFVEPRLQWTVETQHKIPVVCGQFDRARIHLKEGNDLLTGPSVRIALRLTTWLTAGMASK